MPEVFIVLYDNEPIATVENIGFGDPAQVLAWYSECYDFNLSRLSWQTVRPVRYIGPNCGKTTDGQ